MNVGTLVIPERFIKLLPDFRLKGPTAAGISGGRTSALMHALTLAANQDQLHLYLPCFGNTGKEHERTLVFLKQIQEVTAFPIRWLEFQRPEAVGAAPRFARTAEVTYESAHRGMGVWQDFLGTLAEYRAKEKNKEPVAPCSNMRLCTAYMKVKTIHRFVRDHFGVEYAYNVGLRADEPSRVRALKGQERGGVEFLTPLYDAYLTKMDVLEFWAQQPFDLSIPEHLGNCLSCFLKDESDLSTVFYETPGEAEEWIGIQDTYGDFRRGHTSMRTIAAETRFRMEVIRPAVARGEFPARAEGFECEPSWLHQAKGNAEWAYQKRLNKWEEARLQGDAQLPKPAPPARLSWTDEQWADYRWGLLIKQEQRRLKDGPTPFSCACESAQLSGVEEDV